MYNSVIILLFRFLFYKQLTIIKINLCMSNANMMPNMWCVSSATVHVCKSCWITRHWVAMVQICFRFAFTVIIKVIVFYFTKAEIYLRFWAPICTSAAISSVEIRVAQLAYATGTMFRARLQGCLFAYAISPDWIALTQLWVPRSSVPPSACPLTSALRI